MRTEDPTHDGVHNDVNLTMRDYGRYGIIDFPILRYDITLL